MNTEPPFSRDFVYPAGLHFEIPRDFANSCRGTIVAVDDNREPIAGLRITCDRQWITFQSGGTVVQYAADRWLRLLVNYSEKVICYQICTLRSLFRGDGETLSSLLIFSCGQDGIESMNSLIADLNGSNLPFVIQEVDDDTPIQ